MPSLGTVRAVALFEAAKGVLVIVAGFGLLSFVHHDVQWFAEQFVRHLHLNPAKRYPQIFMDAAAELTSSRLWMLGILAASYATARFVEAYGLWNERRWAEWFAAVSGSIYIPFEVYELVRGVNGLSLGILLVNVIIVGVMINALRDKQAEPAS